MDAKKAILHKLRAEGCSVLRLGECPSLGSLALVGKEGRDVLAILLGSGESRSEAQQKFCDNWRGIPPVNLSYVSDAERLAEYIESGEFDRSRIRSAMSGTVVLKTGQKRDY